MKTRIALIVILVLVAVRLAAPPIILNNLNAFLGNFSPVYHGHIEDLDLAIWRGAYRLEGIRIGLKDGTDRPFATAEAVDVSLAWRELLRGRIVTDIVAEAVGLRLSKSLFAAMQAVPEDSANEAKSAGEKVFPLEVARIDLRQSFIESPDVPGSTASNPMRVQGLEGRVSNLLSSEGNENSPFMLRGVLPDGAPLKVAGSFNKVADPLSWVVGAEVRGFKLTTANPASQELVPITFVRGTLDLYAEAKSQGGKITGYLKPFVRDMAVVGDEGDFTSFKHFGIEVGAAAVNLFFRSGEKKTVATRILFAYEEGTFRWNASSAFSDLIKNGYREELQPGLENLLINQMNEI